MRNSINPVLWIVSQKQKMEVLGLSRNSQSFIPLTHLWIGQELPGQFWESSFESLPMLRQWPELVHRSPSAWESWSQGRVAVNHRIIWRSLGWASYPKQGKFWRYCQPEPRGDLSLSSALCNAGLAGTGARLGQVWHGLHLTALIFLLSPMGFTERFHNFLLRG